MLYQAKMYIINRFFDKTHALTSLSLRRGEYHEIDTRILHCLFDTLVDYVEKELAWFHLILEGKPPRFRFRWRSRESGLAHLDWESDLMDDEGQPTSQALSAREIKALYVWWTEQRPKRQDPFDVKGPIEATLHLEKQYATEDEAMLIRLIKIRSNLWT